MDKESDKIIRYFFMLHGMRNPRYAPPERLKPLYQLYCQLTPEEKNRLRAEYEKSKMKLYKIVPT